MERLGSTKGQEGGAPRQGMPRPRRVWPGLIVGALLLLGALAPVSAHQPWFNSEGSPDPAKPYQLPTALEISQVVYGGFAAPGRVDYYAFSAPPGFALDAYLVVPAGPACDRFRPGMALIGPGLPPAPVVMPASPVATPVSPVATPVSPSGTPVAMPVPAFLPTPPPGGGAIVVAGSEWGTLYEEFARVTFATGPRLQQRLAGGDYLIAVFDPAGEIGTYGVTLDGAEVPGGDFQGFLSEFEAWKACTPPAVPAGTPVSG